jgi:site-specific recombinase XerD
MISSYFDASSTLLRFHESVVGKYLDAFAASLGAVGYSHATVRLYLRAVVHLGAWAQRRKLPMASLDEEALRRFRQHLSRCRCGWRDHKGRFQGSVRAADLFLAFLRHCDAIPPAKVEVARPPFEDELGRFRLWMIQRRGLATPTVRLYERYLLPFLGALGGDSSVYDAAAIQRFVIQHLDRRGRTEARLCTVALRAYLRCLVAEGRLAPGLVHCVPAVPQWRLSALPRHLDPPDVERVIASCDVSVTKGLRDRAILLLLARLGLRASDIVAMRVDDVDWSRGTLRVRGKGRRETLLPLPQDAGDALLAYLERGRPRVTIERMFLAVCPPTRPFTTSASVSTLVRVALERAGIEDSPSRGAHLLRHSAATAMLRAGSDLDTISTILRHRSPDSTAHYAKVDVAMLLQVAQPWPGGASC